MTTTARSRYVHPVKVALAERGQTQRAFAPAVGVSPGVLNHILNGRAEPWPALRRRIAQALERPEAELFGGGEHQQIDAIACIIADDPERTELCSDTGSGDAVSSDQLTTDDVAALAGLTSASIRRYRLRGTVPPPDGYLGRTPWWLAETIGDWLAAKPKRGRPKKKEGG